MKLVVQLCQYRDPESPSLRWVLILSQNSLQLLGKYFLRKFDKNGIITFDYIFLSCEYPALQYFIVKVKYSLAGNCWEFKINSPFKVNNYIHNVSNMNFSDIGRLFSKHLNLSDSNRWILPEIAAIYNFSLVFKRSTIGLSPKSFASTKYEIVWCNTDSNPCSKLKYLQCYRNTFFTSTRKCGNFFVSGWWPSAQGFWPFVLNRDAIRPSFEIAISVAIFSVSHRNPSALINVFCNYWKKIAHNVPYFFLRS